MTKKDLKEFESILNEHLQEVTETYESHRKERVSPREESINDIDARAKAQEDDEVEEHIILNDSLYIEKIKKALKRIKDGSYGICESCNQPISSARLRAKPSVSLCIKCQEKRDRASV